MRWKQEALAVVVGISLIPTADAQQQQPPDEPQRQLGAHAHGQGKLGIAIEKRTVEMELEAPGSDIVGFEHFARTTEQKKAVADARTALAKPTTLIKLPDAAGCKVASARVKLVGGGAHDHGHSHGKAKAAKGQAAETHAEFHAEYKFTCTKPELIQALDLDYFKVFPRAEALEISVIGPKGQTRLKATRDNPRVEWKGTS